MTLEHVRKVIIRGVRHQCYPAHSSALFWLRSVEGPQAESASTSSPRVPLSFSLGVPQRNQGCANGVFGKQCFCPLPETGGFDEKWRKRRFTFYLHKQVVALLRAWKPEEDDENGGCASDKATVCQEQRFRHPAERNVLLRCFISGARSEPSGQKHSQFQVGPQSANCRPDRKSTL